MYFYVNIDNMLDLKLFLMSIFRVLLPRPALLARLPLLVAAYYVLTFHLGVLIVLIGPAKTVYIKEKPRTFQRYV